MGMELVEIPAESTGHEEIAEPIAEGDKMAQLVEACLLLAQSTQQLTDVVAATIAAGEER